MAASCRDSYVTGNTGDAEPATGRTACLSLAAEGIHTVYISMLMFHQWMVASSSARGEEQDGATSPFHICPSAPYLPSAMISVASLMALWTWGTDMQHLPVQYC